MLYNTKSEAEQAASESGGSVKPVHADSRLVWEVVIPQPHQRYGRIIPTVKVRNGSGFKIINKHEYEAHPEDYTLIDA